MKHFWRTFWSLLSVWQWRELPPWTKQDSEQLKSYLNSRSGKVLAQKLRNASISINARAVDNGGGKWACGQACGWQQCASFIQTLSATWEPQSDEQSEDGAQEGADAFFERMSP